MKNYYLVFQVFNEIKCCAYPVEGMVMTQTAKSKRKNKTLMLNCNANKYLILANYDVVNEPRGENTFVMHKDEEKTALACHVIGSERIVSQMDPSSKSDPKEIVLSFLGKE